MKNLLLILSIIFLSGCTSQSNNYYSSPAKFNDFQTNEYYQDSYDEGYEWAENEGIDNFDDCQDQFGTGEAEDGCNEYVKENNTGYRTFNGYDCTEDCSGHEAGYEWAEKNDINDIYDCNGNSQSFNEGCESYVEENY